MSTKIEWTGVPVHSIIMPMAQTKEGALKIAAKKAGINPEEYAARCGAGEKWCSPCRGWHPIDRFGKDSSRWDGLSAACFAVRRQRGQKRGPHKSRINPHTGRPGPVPLPARDDDRNQARHRVNLEVRSGRRPRPNALPCVDCGHEWSEGERRHEYDHYLGYAAEHHLDVEAVCTTCHHKRELSAQCKHGHEFTLENTKIERSGARTCLTCRRARDRKRRDAAWWREYRARRRSQANG